MKRKTNGHFPFLYLSVKSKWKGKGESVQRKVLESSRDAINSFPNEI